MKDELKRFTPPTARTSPPYSPPVRVNKLAIHSQKGLQLSVMKMFSDEVSGRATVWRLTVRKVKIQGLRGIFGITFRSSFVSVEPLGNGRLPKTILSARESVYRFSRSNHSRKARRLILAVNMEGAVATLQTCHRCRKLIPRVTEPVTCRLSASNHLEKTPRFRTNAMNRRNQETTCGASMWKPTGRRHDGVPEALMLKVD